MSATTLQATGYFVMNKTDMVYLSLVELSGQGDMLLGKLSHLYRARFLPRQGKQLDQRDYIQ